MQTTDLGMQPNSEAAIIDALYRGACDEGELQCAVVGIAEHFDCPSLLFGDLDLDHPERSLLIGAGNMDAGQIRQYLALAHIDPAAPVLARLPLGTAGLTYRLIDDRGLKHTDFHDAFTGPMLIDHAMATPLRVTGSNLAMMALHQMNGRRILGDDDVTRLERLAPHLARVLHIRRAFFDLRVRQSTYAEVVDRSATGLIGLGRDGAVIFVNAAMRALAIRHDGLSLDRRGTLVLADREASRQAARQHADVLGGGAGGYVRVPRPSLRSPYVLSVSRLPAQDDALPPGGVLFAVVDPSRRVPSVTQVGTVLGLPPGPAKVVQALVSGEELKSYAGRAGLGLSTVRTHLKAAFQRTGTHCQSDLVRLTLATLGDLVPLWDPRGEMFGAPPPPKD